MSFSSTQLNAMAISPKVAASLSIPGSCFILYETVQDSRQQPKTTPMQRALAGMSVIDILSSSAWFVSTWAAPRDTGAPFAAGNRATCRAQGVFLQVAIGAPLYNGALILYYLLLLKYQWTSQDLARRLEPWLHVLIWIWCLGTSAVVLGLDQLHFIGPVCWIGNPPECYLDEIPSNVNCQEAKKYSTFLFCVPLWMSISLTIYALVEIYRVVHQTLHKMNSHREAGGVQVNSLRRSSADVKAVALRSVLYSLAFVITWTPSTIWSVAQWFDYFPFWVSYMWTLFEPLQGFWNCAIFVYNRPQSRQKLKKLFNWLCCGIPETLSSYVSKTSTADATSTTQSKSKSSQESTLRSNDLPGPDEDISG